jgi:hypothetical protein
MSPIPPPSPHILCALPEPVPCTPQSPSSSVELSKISCVNRTEEKIVEKIVYVNSTVEVPKSIFVEKNLTEGTVCTCKAGYYYSAAGARF